MREKFKKHFRQWAMLCHLSALLWLPLAGLIFCGIPLYLPFFNILGPFIIWQWKKTQDPWIDFQGKESINFQLSLTVYAFIVIVISLLLVLTTFGLAMTTNLTSKNLQIVFNSLLIFLSGFIAILMLLQLILVTLAAIKAYRGTHYRYPLTIRFLR